MKTGREKKVERQNFISFKKNSEKNGYEKKWVAFCIGLIIVVIPIQGVFLKNFWILADFD